MNVVKVVSDAYLSASIKNWDSRALISFSRDSSLTWLNQKFPCIFFNGELYWYQSLKDIFGKCYLGNYSSPNTETFEGDNKECKINKN